MIRFSDKMNRATITKGGLAAPFFVGLGNKGRLQTSVDILLESILSLL